MKQKERTELTKKKIIEAGIQEFGTKGYAGFTLNGVCYNHGISKGLFYHNFKGKDELYLACVSKCFSDVTAFLKEQNIKGDLRRYLELRFQYFLEHPSCARIFFEALLQPQPELADAIAESKKEFNQLNRNLYRTVLTEITLRDGVTQEEALDYYEIIQEMFNGYFSSETIPGGDLENIMIAHEEKLSRTIDFMLYGIAQK